MTDYDELSLSWEREAELPAKGREYEKMEEQQRVGDAMAQAIKDLRAENERLLIAFHDAIRRPMGVVPASGDDLYNERMADEAEARRPHAAEQIPEDTP